MKTEMVSLLYFITGKRQSINGKEFDTYKVGTVANSCSTMHKIQEKEFTLDDFSCEYLASESIEILEDTINNLNKFRDYYNNYDKKNLFYIDNDQQIVDKKVIWWQMIQCLPSSYNQTRNVMMNYEVLANIYKSRKVHRLDEWREFCKWIEYLPWSELICQWSEEELKQTDEKLKEEIENGDFRKYMNEPTNELIGDNDNMDARRQVIIEYENIYYRYIIQVRNN